MYICIPAGENRPPLWESKGEIMKKKWYRNNFIKTILTALVCTAMAAAAMCAGSLIYMAEEGFNPLDSHQASTKGYLESERFEDELYNSSSNILSAISENASFSDMGENPVIDLKEVMDDTDELTYKETSGLAYSMEDLVSWAEDSWSFAPHFDDGTNIIVCVKPDGTNEYFYYADFVSKLENGSLSFIFDPDYLEDYGETADSLMSTVSSMLRYGGMKEDDYDWLSGIAGENGKELYTTVYNYIGNSIPEKYAPVGAGSLLDVLNNDSYWNPRISEAFLALNNAIQMAASFSEYPADDVLSHYLEGDTNLSYFYMDNKTQTVYTNQDTTPEQALNKITDSGAYIIFRPQLSDCETNLAGPVEYRSHDVYLSLDNWHLHTKNLAPDEDFVFAVSVDTSFPVKDTFAAGFTQYKIFARQAKTLIWGLAASLLLLAAGTVWLTVTAGRKSTDEDIHLCFFDHWFTEVSAAFILCIWALPFFVLAPGMSYFSQSGLEPDTFLKLFCSIAAVCGLYTALCFFAGYLSLVRRIKARVLWKGSLLHWVLSLIKKVWNKSRNFLGLYSQNTGSKIKLTLGAVGFLAFQFFLIFGAFCVIDDTPAALVLFLTVFLADAAMLACVIKKASGQEYIMDGLKRISGGELQYKIPSESLTGEQKIMSEYINNIGSGLDAAVENSLKNERMKTELITNVSHDIKTPLTSIISYVDLLKRENFTDPKICGYLNILEEKANRLKILTEDVVEASKASTGNISLEMTDLDFVEMVCQVMGEFEEKFRERNLTMVVHFTDEPSVIYADGQRMWRVLENIFTNVSKYALEGTRVYAEILSAGKKVSFSLKNISAQPLNFSAEELTERFIRGDVSRNTEGSGLGLSIAKSLTELQGGEFSLYLDGDLFKVTITFAAK